MYEIASPKGLVTLSFLLKQFVIHYKNACSQKVNLLLYVTSLKIMSLFLTMSVKIFL